MGTPSLLGVLVALVMLGAQVAKTSDLSAFSACMASFMKGNNSSSMRVTYQYNEDYPVLQTRNAQLRGTTRMPAAIVQPASSAEVAAAVRCSNTAGLKFVARNGGHSYEANSLVAGGVVIDVLAMQEVKIDAPKGTLTVGAGQRLGPLYATLAKEGYVLPGGTCAGVGVSGLTLGGGIGHSTRALGVLADNVLGATVVLANGTVVEANSSSHPDLFWAIRGGGPFYGIVTSWRFKLHKAPQQVSVVRYNFKEGCTEAKYAQVLAAFNAWKPWTLSKDHAMVEIQCGYGKLHVQFWLWGPMAAANRTMAASPVFKLSGLQPYLQHEFNSWLEFVVYFTNLHDDKEWGMQELGMSTVLSNDFVGRSSFVAASILPMSPYDSKAVAVQAKAMARAQQHAFIQSRVWGGQMLAVGNDFDAFPWRGALYENQVYSNSGTYAVDSSWVNGLLDAMHPLVGGAEYYNYYHCVKDPWATYFGAHAARLKKIKALYDPLNRMGGLFCQTTK